MHAGPSGTSHGVVETLNPRVFCCHVPGGPPPPPRPGRLTYLPQIKMRRSRIWRLRAALAAPRRGSRAPGWQIQGTRAPRAGPRGQPMKSSATKQRWQIHMGAGLPGRSEKAPASSYICDRTRSFLLLITYHSSFISHHKETLLFL